MDSARTVDDVVRTLARRGALGAPPAAGAVRPWPSERRRGADVVVVVDGNVPQLTRSLIGEAAELAAHHGGRVVAFCEPVADDASLATLGSWGADLALFGDRPRPATGLAEWTTATEAMAVFAPATAYGRAVCQALADDIGCNPGVLPTTSRLFSAHSSIQVLSAGPVPIVTVRAGFVGLRAPRDSRPPALATLSGDAPAFVPPLVDPRHIELADAQFVLCVGAGVDPVHYATFEGFCRRLRASLCATRKVTDRGWLPRSMHVGSSGHVIAPRLCLLVGASGNAHFRFGTEAAGTICALNDDASAPVWDFADTGLIGDWREYLAPLVDAMVAVTVSAAAER